MEDEGEQPELTEDEEEAQYEATRRKSRMKKLIALAIAAVIVGGGGVWFVFLSNAPPVADFRAEQEDLLILVSADLTRDPNGNIATYVWSWGDGSPNGQGLQTNHTYDSEGNYTVSLSVTDEAGASHSASKTFWMHFSPAAVFIARTERMVSSFDASMSFVRTAGVTIRYYDWNFGDGSAPERTTTPTTTHTYATPGRYRVWLNVTDSSGRTGATSRFVSPATTTVDILLDQFFEAGCPYEYYWFLRKAVYGDVILRNQVPCTDFYPWVLVTAKDPVTGQTLGKVNPSWVYALYRLDAKGRNHPEYTVSQPVMFPLFNQSIAPNPDSYIDINITFDYMGNDTMDELAAQGWPVDPGLGDGFGYLVRGNITMDLQMSKRIFDVRASNSAEAQAWWWANTRFRQSSGTIESRFAAWLEELGKGSPPGTGKYDIYNAFEWYYVPDITDINATVSPDGTTRLQIFWDGWGYEILLARWFYWGGANYRQAVCVAGSQDPTCPATLPYGAVEPRGWLPQESCWCEKAVIKGRIGQSLDLDYSAINGYSFSAWGNPGPDSFLGTPDDLPAWVLNPVLMDYVPREGGPSNASQGYPNSEIRWYEGMTSLHGSPGSYKYGEEYEFLVAPARWALRDGSALTLVMPKFPVPWYDPARSTWNTNTLLGDYVTFNAPMTLRFVSIDGVVTPAGGFYIWDSRGKIVSMAGPWTYPTTMPLVGSPWIEFAPE